MNLNSRSCHPSLFLSFMLGLCNHVITVPPRLPVGTFNLDSLAFFFFFWEGAGKMIFRIRRSKTPFLAHHFSNKRPEAQMSDAFSKALKKTRSIPYPFLALDEIPLFIITSNDCNFFKKKYLQHTYDEEKNPNFC